MVTCLYCKKEFQEKRKSAKFCSTSCRVMYNRNKPKTVTETAIEKDIFEALSEMKDIRKQIVSDLFMFGQARLDGKPLIKGFTPETKFEVKPVEVHKTFQQHMNHIATLVFPDDKQDYILEIQAASNLSQKQKELLITNIKNSRF